MSAMAELAADVDRFGIGANNPPEAIAVDPFDGLKVHIEDTLIEARNFADGQPVTTEEMDEAVKRIIEALKDGATAAEKLRVDEKAPLDKKIEAIQARFNVYIAPLKNKIPGKIPTAIEALNACRKPYLDKLQADIDAAAAKARAEANAAAAAAAEAARSAAVGDFSAREAAEELIATAKVAERVATVASKAKVTGFRKFYTTELADSALALSHYRAHRPEELKLFLLSLAKADVLNGSRKIPGFTITEDRKPT